MDRVARVALVVSGLVLVLPAVAVLVVRDAASVQAQVEAGDGFDSGGIGLDREAWEAEHGPGEVGQSLVTYEGGAYTVGFEGGLVWFIERGWEAEGNVAFDDALADVEDLLPSDAELVETFVLPATAGGPISLLAARYESDAIDGRYEDGNRSDGILVLYQQVPADGFESDVGRVSIAVGNAP